MAIPAPTPPRAVMAVSREGVRRTTTIEARMIATIAQSISSG